MDLLVICAFARAFTQPKGQKNSKLRLLSRKIFPWICKRKKPGKAAEKVESSLKRI
jgi:hypothetical protein